jgi:DNA adenine methylase
MPIQPNPKKDCPVVIPYYGGKYKLSKILMPMIPPHERYFEPFFGGGSMFFRKEKVSWNILNDIDNDLVNLYITVLEKFDLFSECVYWMPRSRVLFDEYKQIILNEIVTDFPNVKRAARYYFIVRNAFNNIPKNPMSKDTYWNPSKMIEELKLSKEKLSGSTIENMDFKELIARYDSRPNDFFYFDPPYVVAETAKNTHGDDYYRHIFNSSDHEKLRNLALYLDDTGSKFMISYDNNEEIIDLYQGPTSGNNVFTINKISTKYAGRRKDPGKIFKELVITNYKPVQQMEMSL